VHGVLRINSFDPDPLLREPSELIGVGPAETFNLVIRRTSA